MHIVSTNYYLFVNCYKHSDQCVNCYMKPKQTTDWSDRSMSTVALQSEHFISSLQTLVIPAIFSCAAFSLFSHILRIKIDIPSIASIVELTMIQQLLHAEWLKPATPWYCFCDGKQYSVPKVSKVGPVCGGKIQKYVFKKCQVVTFEKHEPDKCLACLPYRV